MAEVPAYLCDGIATIASHNGVHRIVLYRLTNDPNPEPVVELQVPEPSITELVNALDRLKR